jgi:hypothetical protein
MAKNKSSLVGCNFDQAPVFTTSLPRLVVGADIETIRQQEIISNELKDPSLYLVRS